MLGNRWITIWVISIKTVYVRDPNPKCFSLRQAEGNITFLLCVFRG